METLILCLHKILQNPKNKTTNLTKQLTLTWNTQKNLHLTKR